MPSFEYQAIDASGKKQKGFLDADSDRAARQSLRDRKLVPVTLTEARQKSQKSSGRTIPSKEISLFTQQFAALVQSAIPLEEAIHIASEQTRNRALKRVLQAVRSKILEGHTLAEGLRDHPKAFPNVYCALVSAGEQSGDLGKVLMRLADYTTRAQQLRSSVLQAAIYPAVLTIVSIAVIVMLMAYVVPKVVEQFSDMGQELPLLTRIMIQVSDFVVHQGWILLLVLFGVSFLWRSLLKNARFKLGFHQNLLRLPLTRNIISNIETARLLNALSIMVNSGSPLLDALNISKETLNNLAIRNAVSDAATAVKEGQSLSKSLGDSGLFPPIAVYMVANGEQSGELGTSLEQAAHQQDNLVNNTIAITTRLIEPLLIIIFGALVLTIVLAILLPILQLNNLTQL